MTLLDFTHSIIESLLKEGKCAEKRPVGRPSFLRLSFEQPKKRGIAPTVTMPNKSVITDKFSHLPSMEEKSVCRHCKVGIVRVKCTKCGVYLCLTTDRNCFYDFHLS